MWDSIRDTDVKNRLLDSVGEGEGEMIWENSTETVYIIICEIEDQSKFDAWNRGLKASVLGQPWGMGWGGRWEEVQDGGHMYTHGWFMSVYGQKPPQYCKVISLQLK